MKQYEQVLTALKKIGGQGTLQDIYNAIDDINTWGAKNKKASISSYLSKGLDITKYDNTWIYKFADETEAEYQEAKRKWNSLYCSDGFMQTAKIKSTKSGWKILVLPYLHKKGELD